MKRYIEAPQDVQMALHLVLSVFGREARPRPVYGAAIRRACRILGVDYNARDDRWELWRPWRERMKLAGLDPGDPFKVLDQRRWDLCWEQLVETETFQEHLQKRALAQGRQAPRAEERVKCIARKQREPKRETFEQYLPRALEKKLFRGNK
jgi:hypothetical protein